MAVSSGDVAQLTPDPPLSVAHCKGFQKSQRFDVTALVTSVGPVRKVTDQREVRNVHIMDGSKFSNGKTAEIKVQFFSEKPPKIAEQEIIDLLGAAEGKPIPLSFLLFKASREKTGIRSKIPLIFFLSSVQRRMRKLWSSRQKVRSSLPPHRRRKRCCNQPSRQRTAGITRTSKEQRLSLGFCGMIVVRSM